MEASSTDTTDEDETIAALAFLEPPAKPGHLGRMAHYEVHEVIGRGAFGIVLRAFDEKLHRMVAIKAMTPEMAATSPPRKRFLREARSAAAIRNENIVSIYAVEEQPIPYLVMEYVPGQTLQQRIDQTGPLDIREILNLGRQIAEGLAAAHEQGLIHRDIKPSNILLETSVTPRAKLSDFGLARAADDASLTQSGYIAGTPMYMAPEQARGEAIDARADLFSLGSVLYVMCTGRPPFRASGTLAVLKRVCEDTPRPIQEIIPEVPDWLCRLIGKLHSKTPDERIQTAKEVASLLGRGLARSQNPLARQGRSASPQSAASNSVRPKKTVPAKARSRTSGKWWAAGLLIAAGLLASVWAFLPKTSISSLVSDVKVPATDPASGSGSKPLPSVTATPALPPPLAISPFDAAQAKRHQQAWADHLKVPVEFTNSIGMKFVLIPPGEFMMGSSPQELEKMQSYVEDFFKPWVHLEGPQRYVVVNEPFYLGALEVTRRQFGEFAKATRYSSEAAAQGGGFIWDGVGGFKRDPAALWSTIQPTSDDSFPVDCLTTKDISAFCEWMKKEFHGDYVIPNEEQWEYAVRAGSETRYFFGNDDSQLMKYAQITSLSQDHGPKGGLLKPNPFGLFDVYGSLNERVLGTDTKFVGRGGHWSTPTMCRSSHRAGQEDEPRMGQGYRLAIVGDLKKAVEQMPATKAAPSAPSTAGTDKIKANAPPMAVAPFSAAQALKHQDAWAKHLDIPVEFTNRIGMKFRLIPPGEFVLGSSPEEIEKLRQDLPDLFKPWVGNEGPQRRVVLHEPYYLAQFELTRRQFGRFVQAESYVPQAAAQGGGLIWGDSGGFKRDPKALWNWNLPPATDDFPVQFLTSTDVDKFCEWLTRECRGEYVLPTEEQWEFAVRAGTTTRYFFGDNADDLPKYAQVQPFNHNRETLGGQLSPNPFGLFDVYGGFHEQVHGYEGARVDRGGLSQAPAACRSAHRQSSDDEPSVARGYRLAIVGDLKKAVEQGRTAMAASSPPSVGPDETRADAPPRAVAPFSAAQALQHQAAWAKHLGMPVEFSNSIGMKFRLVPPGRFRMGSSQAEIDGLVESANSPESAPYRDELLRSYRSEGPQRNVVITQPFYLGSTEVRQIDYSTVTGGNPSCFSKSGEGKSALMGEETTQYPVESVSWDDAAEFCRKLSVREGITPFPSGVGLRDVLNLAGYRLPTEAEWEYACRAGTETRHWTGDSGDTLKLASWMAKPSGHRTDKVGVRSPNPFGLHDVYGNVWEWVRDSWRSQPEPPVQLNVELKDPDLLDSTSDLKVVRGGDAASWPGNLRSATRNPQSRSRVANTIGFRVALSVGAARLLLERKGGDNPNASPSSSP